MEKAIVSKEYSISVTEVLDILKYLPENMVSKIPDKFMQFLKENSIQDYEPEFDYSQGLDKLLLSNKTKALLAMIYRNYICSEEERAAYDKILIENEREHQNELKEKYNPDDIFKNNKNTEKEENSNTQLVEYKEPKWYRKLFNSIVKLFNR